MSWIRHRRPNFSPDFSAFLLDLHAPSRQNPGQAPVHVLGTWHPCASSHATAPGPTIITWLMRHQPALITCLHSRPCFWTPGPRPLPIVPTISARFRLPPISYHPCKFSHWATYALGIPIAIAPLFPFDPQPVLLLSRYSSSIVLHNPFVPHSDNGSRSTIVQHSIYTCTVASPGPHLDLLVFGPRYAPVCIRYSLLTLGLWAQFHLLSSVLTAANPNTFKISKFVASCRVEP